MMAADTAEANWLKKENFCKCILANYKIIVSIYESNSLYSGVSKAGHCALAYGEVSKAGAALVMMFIEARLLLFTGVKMPIIWF